MVFQFCYYEKARELPFRASIVKYNAASLYAELRETFPEGIEGVKALGQPRAIATLKPPVYESGSRYSDFLVRNVSGYSKDGLPEISHSSYMLTIPPEDLERRLKEHLPEILKEAGGDMLLVIDPVLRTTAIDALLKELGGEELA